MTDSQRILLEGYNSSPLYVLAAEDGVIVFANKTAAAVADRNCIGCSVELIFGEELAAATKNDKFLLRDSVFFDRPCILEFRPGELSLFVFMPLNDATQDEQQLHALAAFANELKEPLSEMFQSLELFRSFLPTDEKAAKAAGYYSVLERDLYKLLRLSDYITSVHNLTFDDSSFSPVTDDMVDLVKKVVAESKLACESMGIPVTLKCEENSILSSFDRALVERMLLCLIGNSFKYTREGNEITVRLSSSKTRIFITVEDKGAGIPSEALSTIFTSLDFAALSAKQSFGLRIVHGIAAIHGGSVALETRIGVGTTVSVSLPKNLGSSYLCQSHLLYSGIPTLLIEFSSLLPAEAFSALKLKLKNIASSV